MNSKRPLQQIPVASTDLLPPVRFEVSGSEIRLLFNYLSDGKRLQSGFEFLGVRAHRHRAETHCTEWHIAEAYDTLVEVSESEWAREVRADTAEGWKDHWLLRHLMIYLDSEGCFELLADSWRLLPPVETSAVAGVPGHGITTGPDELEEIIARYNRASPGPWTSMIEGRDHTSGSSCIVTGPPNSRGNDFEISGATPEDQDFIASARQDIPQLVEEVKRLRSLLNNQS